MIKLLWGMIANSQLFSVLSRFISSMSWFCGANQWTGFYMITASDMKELNVAMIIREQCSYGKPSSFFLTDK